MEEWPQHCTGAPPLAGSGPPRVHLEGSEVHSIGRARVSSPVPRIPRWFRSLASLVGMVLIVLGWPALPAQAAGTTMPGISGTVTLPDSSPAANASVCLYLANGYRWGCVNADAEGAYLIGDPGSGDLVVGAQVDGHLTTYYAASGSTAAIGQAGKVVYASGTPLTGIDIRMVKGATVSGTVRLGTQPLPDASVCAADRRCTETGDDGTFALQVVPGTVKLKAEKYDDPSQYLLRGTSPAVTVVDNQSYTLDISVPEGTGITGTVSLPSGDEAQFTVRAYQVTAAGEVLAAVHYYWNSSGAYGFRDLAAGTYVVRFRADGYRDRCYGGTTCTPVTVTAGHVTTSVDVTMAKLDPGNLSGKVVTGAGQPISGVAVKATYGTAAVSATTNAAGVYTLSSLAAGLEWNLEFSKAGYGTRTTAGVPEEDTTTTVATVRLFQNGSVAGTVRGVGGAPLAGADVYLSGPASVSATTDASGRYSFASVPMGHYRVSVFATADYLAAYYPGVQDDDEATFVSVPENGSVTGIDVQLVKPVTISGRITDAGGAGLSGYVYLYREGDDDALSSVRVDADGAFSFSGEWPGKYTIRAQAGWHVDTWLGNQSSQETATWITVDSGATSVGNTIKLPALPGHTVSGTVRDSDGQLAEGMNVSLLRGDENSSITTTTDDQGAFSFGFMEAATYGVSVGAGGTEICGPELVVHCSTSAVTVTATSAPALALTLPKLGSLSGAVTNPSGTYYELELLDSADNFVAYTDPAAGPYRFNNLPYGTYTLRKGEGEDLLPYSATVQIDGAVTKDVTLSAAFTISGKVAVAQKEAWVEVVALDPVTGEEAAASSRRNVKTGQFDYQLTGLLTGDYVVGVQADGNRSAWYPAATDPLAATKVTVSTASLTGIDLTVPSPTAGRFQVTGKLTVPAGVATDALEECSVDPADCNLDLAFENTATGARYSASIGASDTYSAFVPKGNYVVTASRSEDLGTAEFTGDLRVTANRTYDITLSAGGGLSGRFVDAAGVGVEKLYVTATVNGEVIADADVDQWGYWTLKALPAGARVTLEASPRDDYTGNYADYRSGPYPVVGGKVTDLGNQKLTSAGRIKVHIPSLSTDLYDMKVTAVVTDLAGNELVGSRVTTDDDDTAVITVPAGQVLVRFQGQGIVTEWWKDASTMAAATRITVTAGRTAATIVPKLALGTSDAVGTLSGTVTNSSGLSGTLSVLVTDGHHDLYAPVASNGAYSVVLDPGVYKVRAALCHGYWMGESGCMGDRLVAWYQGSTWRDSESVTVTSGKTTANVNLDVYGDSDFTAVPTPAITGNAVVGGILTANPGTWVPTPSSFSYRWLRDGAVIPGATAATYQIQLADLGMPLSVSVVGSRAGVGTAVATSARTAAVTVGALTAVEPTIKGAPSLGATLTAESGGWGPAPVSFTYQWNRNGTAIAGATGSTYKVTAADAGATLTVTVTGAKPGYASATRTSAGTAVLLAFTPGTPTISGTARIGSTLTAATGSWTPTPTSFAYQWNRAGKAIAGATQASYAVQPADAGAAITVTVTAKRAGYVDLARTSAATASVPSLVFTAAPVPTISGTARVGSKLTAKAGTWTPGPVTLSYQWYRGSVAIAGATGAVYTPVGVDAGAKLTVKVTGTRSGYATVTRTSKATVKVASGKLTVGTPTISGTARVGETLTASPGTWSPAGTSLSYAWYRSGKAIKNATKQAYLLVGADLGKKLTVKVTGTAVGYAKASKVSKATARIAPAKLVVGTVKLGGTPAVGKTLTADAGNWGPAPVSFGYAWYRSGRPIGKATKASYVLTASDLGKTITVRVTGTKPGYATASATSAPTSAVSAGTLNAGVPTISGTPKVGQRLTVKPGSWGPGTVSFTYQWKRDGQVIATATKASYTATSADAGAKLTVAVTGTEVGYTSATRESAAVEIAS